MISQPTAIPSANKKPIATTVIVLGIRSFPKKGYSAAKHVSLRDAALPRYALARSERLAVGVGGEEERKAIEKGEDRVPVRNAR